MLYIVKINDTDEKRAMYLSTVCIYKTQEDMDLDITEDTDGRAILIKNNNVSFKEIIQTIGATPIASDVVNYITLRGDNLFNSSQVQEEIVLRESMPYLPTI